MKNDIDLITYKHPGFRNELTKEVRYIYFSLFNKPPSQFLIDCYINAHSSLPDNQFSIDELRTVHKIITKKINILCIEPPLRRETNRHALTQKIHLTIYLSECSGLNNEEFYYLKGRLYFWLSLPTSGAMILYRRILGYLMVKLYALV